jgi:hypothetical protein
MMSAKNHDKKNLKAITTKKTYKKVMMVKF